MLAKLDTDYLWGFLDRQIAGFIDNWRIQKEDVAVTLLRTLAVKLSPRAFLEALKKPRSGTKSKPRLYLLVDKLDGYNFTAYVNIVWEAWRNTNYSKLNPAVNHAMDVSGNAPALLPYKSNEMIGFHHDNASVDLNKSHTKIDVEVDLEVPGIIKKASFSRLGKLTITEEKGIVRETENYSYDPFAPLVIINEINPHFIFKDQSGGAGEFTILPAFVLFAREEGAFWSNSALAAEYAVDLLTTFTGIGSILKAGRIFKLLKSGKSILFMSKNATTATGYALKSKGIIEITSGVGNTLLKLTGANKTEAGKAVSEYLFYLELLSMGGELTEAFQRVLKNAAYKAAKSSDEIIEILEKTDDAVKKYTDDLTRLGKLQDAALNLSIDTYYALIHLWETAGIIVRNFEQFTDQVKLALMEFNIQIFDVLTRDIDEFFNILFPRYSLSMDGALEKVIIYNDEVLFAGTKKQFNEFAKKVNEAAKKGRGELKKLVDDTWKYFDIMPASQKAYKKSRSLEKTYATGAKVDFEKKVKYLNKVERKEYEIFIQRDKVIDKNGNLFNTKNCKSIDKSGATITSNKAIFVMSETGEIFISKLDEFGVFHHSSFLSGEKIAAAGEIIIEEGIIKYVNNKSGHYMPLIDNVKDNLLLELYQRDYFVGGFNIKEEIIFKSEF
ncbi:MAG: hypothetical protein GQ574_08350 [Crocinitomix sp.]|nr:hypothetical protein [Crocinitomix sp.]